MLDGKRILLIITGGIAAYKSLDLIRRLRERGASVRCVLTRGAQEMVTPLAAAALSEDKVYTDLFSLTDEAEMGHIQLSRDADLLVVAPATADILARMTAGLADDLATTVLLATDKPVLVAPAMNVRMWEHAATRANLAMLRARGILTVGPDEGPMACNEFGFGRMSEVPDIVAAVESVLGGRVEAGAAPTLPASDPAYGRIGRVFSMPDQSGGGALRGRRALVTSGPTHEAIDPVRYIANRSSGKQGHAIAAALAAFGAEVVLVSGPTDEPDPPGVSVTRVQSARQMLAACEAALPVDVAVCAAAVADWRVSDAATEKLKKGDDQSVSLTLVENPDILRTLAGGGDRRPQLVIGFAAETENLLENARAKRRRKGCDWIVANDVSPERGVFGGDENTVTLIRADGEEAWPTAGKVRVAARLAEAIGAALGPLA